MGSPSSTEKTTSPLASPLKSPFSEERISSIAGKGKGKSRRRLPDAESDSTSTRYSLSHDSLVSLVPTEGGVSGGSGEDADSVAPLAKPLRHNVSLSDLEDHAAGLGRDSGASRASSAISLTSTISAGGGGSRAKPPRDSNLPGAPGRFLSWMRREPTLEGTLEKQKTEGYFGSTMRLLGLGSRGWKMRHYVLYDNHLFWGRGFSRMYGYGTVLSARLAPEMGETAFALELVTHPKFSLRRGGFDSLDYWQRLYGLCCSTHGYSLRMMRAGTVIDRDRWVTALQQALLAPTGSPTSPARTMLHAEERSVFAVENGTLDRPSADGASEDGEKRPSSTTTPTTREAAREQSGLWTPNDRDGREAAAVAAWEEAARMMVDHEAEESARAIAEAKRGMEDAHDADARKDAMAESSSGSEFSNFSPDEQEDDGFATASESGESPAMSPAGARRGESVPAEWLSANGGGRDGGAEKKPPPAPALRRTSSLAKKNGGASLNIADLFGLGGGASGERDGSRKVTFLDDAALESTVEYAPTPTKRNPGGVGKTAAKLAPFGGGGASTATSEGDLLEPGLQSAAHRALRHAAGRWVIPPQELKLGCRIGSGSFGQVFTADWNGTEVALKQMHDKSLTGSTVQEFSDEIRVMQGLRHPNVVLFLGAVIQSPTLSIVCELMPLGSLHSLLHGKSRGGGELSSNGRLRRQMAQDCARGMSYLHSRSPPVVHHDLKPANLLVDSHWTLKVSDFGMSRLKHNTYLSSNSPGGTPEWMAPEVLRNDPTDENSDVYSFAVILWELMTLKYPWEELSSPVQIVVQVAFLHRRPKLPTWLPTEAMQLLQQCWHKDPETRPQFAEILESLKAEMPEAWADHPASDSPNSLIAAKAAKAKAELGAAAAASSTPKHKEPPSPSFSELSGSHPTSPSPSLDGGFVSLKGLRPIKTPAPAVKKSTRALGPNHMTESGSSSEDDGDAPPGPQGYSRGGHVGKPPSTARANGANGANGVNGVNGAVRGFPPAAKVLMNGDVPMSPEMKAAGALKMPGLSPLKITPRAGG